MYIVDSRFKTVSTGIELMNDMERVYSQRGSLFLGERDAKIVDGMLLLPGAPPPITTGGL